MPSIPKEVLGSTALRRKSRQVRIMLIKIIFHIIPITFLNIYLDAMSTDFYKLIKKIELYYFKLVRQHLCSFNPKLTVLFLQMSNPILSLHGENSSIQSISKS